MSYKSTSQINDSCRIVNILKSLPPED